MAPSPLLTRREAALWCCWLGVGFICSDPQVQRLATLLSVGRLQVITRSLPTSVLVKTSMYLLSSWFLATSEHRLCPLLVLMCFKDSAQCTCIVWRMSRRSQYPEGKQRGLKIFINSIGKNSKAKKLNYCLFFTS